MNRCPTTLLLTAALLAPGSALAAKKESKPPKTTIGIGVGISAPSSPIGINTASARLRFSEAVTLEPMVGLTLSRAVVDFSDAGGSTETVSTARDLFLGTNFRYHVNLASRADLIAILGAGVDFAGSTLDPEGNDNRTFTNSTILNAGWGLGVEWYASKHWSVSTDATNPLVTYTSTRLEDEATETDTTASAMDFAAVWSPTVRVMAHLYF